MEGNPSASRRSVLKTVGGVTAASALGGLATGPAAAGHEDGKAVRVNQVGYRTDGQKLAVVTSGSDLDPTSVSSFEVRDASSGETVTSGDLMSAIDDSSSGHTVKHADFSDVTEAGEYVVAVDGHESHPFQIGSETEVYGDLLAHVGRLYTLKRCNADVQDPITGLDIGPGHEKDENAIVAEPGSNQDNYNPSPSGGNYLDGVDLSPGDTVDVSGGWYDAGDYGKYVTPTAVTLGQMLLAYERHPDIFTEGQFAIPDSIDDPNVGEMPDVLAEAKVALEWLEKMQRSDGALFYIVSGQTEFPEMDVRPEDDDMDRYVFGLSSAGTAMACACFAQAARIFQNVDDHGDFADRMLSNAEDAFAWLDDNEDLVWLMGQPWNQGSGPYTRDGDDTSDRYWAAAELLRTTGESKYETFISNLPTVELFNGNVVNINESDDSGNDNIYTQPMDWDDPVTLGHIAYYEADGENADQIRTGLEGSFVYGLRTLHDPSNGDSIEAYGTGLYDYYWGCVKSGVARGAAGLITDSILSYDTSAANWAEEPLHHVLGRSATGYSYMTGAGEKHADDPHDRIVNSTGVLPTGMVVGGPNPNYEAGAGNHLGSDFNASDTPALAYYDNVEEYSTNEWAINYTAPVFLMLAEMVAKGDEVPDGLGDGSEEEDLPNVGNNENPPQDPDGDGQYEDVNGNGDQDMADAVDLFQNRESSAVQDNADAYDFSGNDELDLADVVQLFQENTS